jgi:hypothetical protein
VVSGQRRAPSEFHSLFGRLDAGPEQPRPRARPGRDHQPWAPLF